MRPSLPALLVSHWRLSWPLNVEAAMYAGLYVWGARRVRSRWPMLRTVSFLAGVGCVLASLQSGVDTFDDRLLSVHMVQHMLLLMVAPPLLLGGRPVILVLRALPARHRGPPAKALARLRPFTGPLQCLGIFSAVVLLTHLPPLYDATLNHQTLHDAEHALYLLAGLLLWWPMLDGDPVPAYRLGGLARLGYVLAAMLPMALVGAYLNRNPALVYPPYGSPARVLGISALGDQAHAGAIMWVAGNMIMVAVGLWAVVAALVAEERRQQAREARSAAVATPRRGAGR